MLITTRFDLGQAVWRTGAADYERVKLPCLFCRGGGQSRVAAVNGVDYAYVKCPRCEGRGSVTITSIPLFVVIGQSRIGKVTVESVDPSIPGYNGMGGRDEGGEKYMLETTGFPSGAVYTMTSLHATLHEAEEDVQVRNQALRQGLGEWKPDRRAVEAARAFLAHRDVYEHTAEHVAAAEQLVAAAEAREEN